MKNLSINNNIVNLEELELHNNGVYSRGDRYVGFDLSTNEWIVRRPVVEIRKNGMLDHCEFDAEIRHSTPLSDPECIYGLSCLVNALHDAGIPKYYVGYQTNSYVRRLYDSYPHLA